jgi:alpha-glucosidase (family GH31 glycosyl hydrolase)
MQGYAAAKIPLDTIWSDIDHMDGYRDFTLDKLLYSVPKMRDFLGKLQQAGRHWVPIVDPGIMIDPGYPAYDAGVQEDVFLRGSDGKPYAGQVCFFLKWYGIMLQPRFFFRWIRFSLYILEHSCNPCM